MNQYKINSKCRPCLLLPTPSESQVLKLRSISATAGNVLSCCLAKSTLIHGRRRFALIVLPSHPRSHPLLFLPVKEDFLMVGLVPPTRRSARFAGMQVYLLRTSIAISLRINPVPTERSYVPRFSRRNAWIAVSLVIHPVTVPRDATWKQNASSVSVKSVRKPMEDWRQLATIQNRKPASKT